MSSPRENEKRDGRDCRGDEIEGRGRKKKINESEETRNNGIPFLPLPATRITGLYFLLHLVRPKNKYCLS